MLRAFHLEVEFREMLISSWLTKGLLKRSSTAEAKSSRSFLSSGRGGDDLLVQHLVHEAADGVVVHAVADDIKACQISAQHKAGVCAVQDADLALLIWGVTSGTTMTLTPAFLNGSLSSRPAGPSMTHTPNTSPTSRAVSW